VTPTPCPTEAPAGDVQQSWLGHDASNRSARPTASLLNRALASRREPPTSPPGVPTDKSATPRRPNEHCGDRGENAEQSPGAGDLARPRCAGRNVRRVRIVARPSENAERAGIGPGVVGGTVSPAGVARLPCQAVLAIQWLWSLSRLWVAVTNRHSDCAAALPLRMNRSTRRLCLICP
jgi:hypothetical protein